MKDTKSFKKRFHGLSLKDKVAVAGLVKDVHVKNQLPSGRKLETDEKKMISELCEWCDENIFFNKMPNGVYQVYPYGLKRSS